MPVVAVAVAVVADVAAGSALIGGALTLTTALTTVAAIGATIGAIGAITGDKTLSEVGMGLGVVGGIGSLASSAGLFGADTSTAPLFGTSAASDVTPLAGDTTSATAADAAANGAAAPGDQIANAATAGADPYAQAAAAEAVPGGTAQDIINSIGQVNTAGTTPQTALDAQTAAAAGNQYASDTTNFASDASTSPSAVGVNTADNSTLPPQQVGVPSGAGSVPSIPGVTAPAAPTASGGNGIDPVTGLPQTASDIPGLKPPVPGNAFDASVASNNSGGVGSVLSKLTDFANSKGGSLATYGLIQAAGSFAQGAFNPVTPAQINAMNAQAAANNASAAKTQQQVANIQSGVPSATVARPNASTATPVQSAPVTGQPQGLINTQAAA